MKSGKQQSTSQDYGLWQLSSVTAFRQLFGHQTNAPGGGVFGVFPVGQNEVHAGFFNRARIGAGDGQNVRHGLPFSDQLIRGWGADEDEVVIGDRVWRKVWKLEVIDLAA